MNDKTFKIEDRSRSWSTIVFAPDMETAIRTVKGDLALRKEKHGRLTAVRIR